MYLEVVASDTFYQSIWLTPWNVKLDYIPTTSSNGPEEVFLSFSINLEVIITLNIQHEVDENKMAGGNECSSRWEDQIEIEILSCIFLLISHTMEVWVGSNSYPIPGSRIIVK